MKTMPAPLTDQQIGIIVQMTRDGYSTAEISRTTGASTYQVSRIQTAHGLRGGANHSLVVPRLPDRVWKELQSDAKTRKWTLEKLAAQIITGVVLKRRIESSVRGAE